MAGAVTNRTAARNAALRSMCNLHFGYSCRRSAVAGYGKPLAPLLAADHFKPERLQQQQSVQTSDKDQKRKAFEDVAAAQGYREHRRERQPQRLIDRQPCEQ